MEKTCGPLQVGASAWPGRMFSWWDCGPSLKKKALYTSYLAHVSSVQCPLGDFAQQEDEKPRYCKLHKRVRRQLFEMQMGAWQVIICKIAVKTTAIHGHSCRVSFGKTCQCGKVLESSESETSYCPSSSAKKFLELSRATSSHKVSPCCALPQDFLSDIPLLRAVGFGVFRHGHMLYPICDFYLEE